MCQKLNILALLNNDRNKKTTNRKWPVNFILSFFLLAFFNTPSIALPEDKKQKLHITADSGIYNYKTGLNIYEGNVKVDQGTTHLTADRLITKSNAQRKIEEAIAYGDQTLAHYWTIPQISKAEVHARAHIIKFYPLDSNVILEKNVVVTQAKNVFHGQLILYNGKEETITVPPTANARATLVYDPEK
ncbi:MAG TPA: lipopolysaccharide transport periplasmic protein LptA [Gammaproteobacteria bacterium]|jgi:lipopolysaccharide export system protein LptA|nr:lipopolysaccharide transport periplasmic protein LptA [Gammaproteobacteria bacterium]